MSEDDKDKIADMNDIWKNIRDTSVFELTNPCIDTGVLKITNDLATPTTVTHTTDSLLAYPKSDDAKFDVNDLALNGGILNPFPELNQDIDVNKIEFVDPVEELKKQVQDLKSNFHEEVAENTKKYNELEERVSDIENELTDLKVQKNPRKRRDKLAQELREVKKELSTYKAYWRFQKEMDNYDAKDITNA